MTSRRLGILSSGDAYPVPWGFRLAAAGDIHQLTNLGRHPLDRVSIAVLNGSAPAAGWSPGVAVALGPGESLEVRVPRTTAASAVVVCWQRPGGGDYLWSAPLRGAPERDSQRRNPPPHGAA
jgi:hypothetical protein